MTNNTNIVKTFSFHGFNRSNIILNAKSHILIELVSYLTYNKFNKKKIVFLKYGELINVRINPINHNLYTIIIRIIKHISMRIPFIQYLF